MRRIDRPSPNHDSRDGAGVDMLVLRLFRDADWMDWDLPWMPHGLFAFMGTLMAIGVVVGLLCLVRRRDWEGPW